ncbi:hypothetical protein HY78_14530 [Rhizorhabdus wittichii DC-6]|nr:hypothetical protein HY78_14530 [Rhizorhabdus wittichii DC-6]
MSDAADLAAIHAEFARPVVFTGGGVVAKPIGAVRSLTGAPAFQGPGQTARKRTYELLKADVPEKPDKSSVLVDGGNWRVIEATDRDDAIAWVVAVERMP